MSPWIITTIVTLMSASTCTYYYIKKRAAAKKKPVCKRINAEDYWNTVLFFPDYFPDNADSTTRKLLWYLDQATDKLDICLFVINFRMIESKLIEIANRGVVIRIITNSKGRVRRTKGIQHRVKIHTELSAYGVFWDLMHNKFVVIDDFACMGGSLNWTKNAITENRENLVITTNTESIRIFAKTFERLWTECGGLKELPWTCGG